MKLDLGALDVGGLFVEEEGLTSCRTGEKESPPASERESWEGLVRRKEENLFMLF